MPPRKQTTSNIEKEMAVLKLLTEGHKLVYTRHYHSEYWYIAGRQQSQVTNALMKKDYVKAVPVNGEYEAHITDAGKEALKVFQRNQLS